MIIPLPFQICQHPRSTARALFRLSSWMLRFTLVLFLLFSCTRQPAGPAPENDTPEAGHAAQIQELSVEILESFPVQVQVTLTGYLPDGCTQIESIIPSREKDEFTLLIETRRPSDMMCIQSLVPFTRTVELDVKGLEAGTYTVRADGLEKTFTLPVKNSQPDV